MRSRWLNSAAAFALALPLAIGGCGFSDELTQRGFLESGDRICAETFVRATVESQADPGSAAQPTQAEILTRLSNGYRDAAARFSALDTPDEDDPMRDRMAAEFKQLAGDLGSAASRTRAGDPGAQQAAGAALQDFTRFGQEIRAYGFELCGGRPQG